jgi:hypothetical protein
MSRTVSAITRTQNMHSWRILLGMLGVPIAALFSKIFPRYDTVWEVLLVICGLIILRSVIGYLFPGLGASHKKSEHATTEI